jgi:hypothetical protein
VRIRYSQPCLESERFVISDVSPCSAGAAGDGKERLAEQENKSAEFVISDVPLLPQDDLVSEICLRCFPVSKVKRSDEVLESWIDELHLAFRITAAAVFGWLRLFGVRCRPCE